MTDIRFHPLVIETAERLNGLSTLIDLVYSATPEVELRERDALKQLARQEGWNCGDYEVEGQLLDVKFRLALPKLAASSIVVMFSSIVETQLLAFARYEARKRKSPFEPNDLKGSVLDRAALFLKKACDLDLTANPHWSALKDLQDLRDIIVHRGGRPGPDKTGNVRRICGRFPQVSLQVSPYSFENIPEVVLSIHSCRHFAREVEVFFFDLFKNSGLPVHAGPWPKIETGFR